MDWTDIRGIAPLLWPLAAALGILAMADKRRTGSKPMTPMLAIVGLLGSLFAIWRLWPEEEGTSLFRGAIVLDGFGLFLGIIVAVCSLATILLSIDYLKRREKNLGEFYVLVLFAAIGMMLMGMSRNFVTILFGLEVMSISLYVLAGLFRERSPSAEASMKYFLTGSFATGLLVFGMGMAYGATGSLDLGGIGIQQAGGNPSPLLVLGLGFMLAGLAFKVAAVPFHMWLPDVYEGAPTTVTGFMAAGVKIAAFGAIIRVFAEVYQNDSESLRSTLWWMSVGTMTIGNVAALAQRSVKRMLAYSSIAHAGYLLLAIVVMQGRLDTATGYLGFDSSQSVEGILYYLLAYGIATVGAFGILAYLERDAGGGLDFDDLAGLKGKQPLLAMALTVFMLSLAGIPGTAGFIGKYGVFAAAVEAAQTTGDESFMLLAVLGILNSLVGLYYYLRVPIQLYAKDLPEAREAEVMPARPPAFRFVVATSLIATLWLGFGPDVMNFGVEPAMQLVKSALESLN